MPRGSRLRKSAEYRLAYAGGKRYDGRFMTAFVLRNTLGQHRLGITASRKMARGAVARNRAKRLLRETFRLSTPALCELSSKYDWVLNAKRSLLEVKLDSPLEDLSDIITRVRRDEGASSAGTGRESL